MTTRFQLLCQLHAACVTFGVLSCMRRTFLLKCRVRSSLTFQNLKKMVQQEPFSAAPQADAPNCMRHPSPSRAPDVCGSVMRFTRSAVL